MRNKYYLYIAFQELQSTHSFRITLKLRTDYLIRNRVRLTTYTITAQRTGRRDTDLDYGSCPFDQFVVDCHHLHR